MDGAKFLNNNVAYVIFVKTQLTTLGIWKQNIILMSFPTTVWKEIKDFYNSKMNQQKDKRNIHKPKRDIFLQYWKPLLESLEQDTSKKFNELYKDHTENLLQK